jgi:hypothetical protein
MNRERNLLIATVAIIVLAVAYWIWSGWGLITVNVDNKPLSSVIQSIERQGGVTLKTNMPADRPISMHVTKVPLIEALETLSAITDSRWRLAYVVASDKGKITSALTAFSNGQKPEGWKMLEVPLFNRMGNDLAVAPDPRSDTWNVNPPTEATLQGYLIGAATGVSATFSYPEDWNPPVSKPPVSGEIRKALPQLAKAANSQYQEVFLLTGRPANATADAPPEGEDEDGPGGGRRRGDGPPNRELMRARQEAELAKLPPTERAARQAEMEEFDKVRKSLADLPEAERRAKMQELFARPDMEQRMEDRRMARDERKTPDQRVQRYNKYVQRKQAAKSGPPAQK